MSDSEVLISDDEVTWAIRHSKDSFPDGVRISHIKQLDGQEMKNIGEEYNNSARTGIIPEEWLHSRLVPVPKVSKDRKEISSYQFISMQNVYGKLMEKMVAKIYIQDLENKKVFHTSMGGCRPGHDTTTNVAILTYNVYEAFQNREDSAIRTLDLEDTYNRINYQMLLSIMCDLEMQPWIIRWTSNALYERTVALSCRTLFSLPISNFSWPSLKFSTITQSFQYIPPQISPTQSGRSMQAIHFCR
jgi:hypothetical protein